MAARLVLPENIRLLPLPPWSPELSPVDNVWQYMCVNWLWNSVRADCDDSVAHYYYYYAWKKLPAQPATITSIALRV